MRSLTLFFLMYFLPFSYTTVESQTSMFSFELPKPGDIHYYMLDNLPDDLSLDFQGHLNGWNFTMLSAPSAHEYTFHSPDKSIYASYFDDPDLVAFDLWQNEKFYKQLGNSLFLVGEVLKSNRNPSNPLLKKYAEPEHIYSSKRRMGEESSYQSKWEIVFNGEELNQTGAKRFTAYKLVGIEDNEERISDSGVLFLPRQRHKVVKLERSVYSSYQLYENISKNNWKEVNLSDYDKLPVELETQRSEVIFMSEGSPEWIAAIKVDSKNKLKNALFKSSKDQVRHYHSDGESNFFLYPNPTFGVVRLDFVNLPSGTYFFEVYNIIGKKISSQKYFIQGYTTIREDLGFLQKGTYIYSLVDDGGKNLFTKRMAIITP